MLCSADSDCDDGLFCNGLEICDPGSRLASADGCAAGAAACDAPATCDEATDACLSDCDLNGDADGDGHDSIACGGDDCDDADATRFPGNVEVCDAEDHDEDCDATTFGELDADRDGYFLASCCNTQPDGGSVCGDDCADDDPNVHPTATETCNGLDDDCDGAVDVGVMRVFHKDADGDGFGDPATSMMACNPPDASWVENDTDCDDMATLVNPAATEICDGVDNDCDAMIDERGMVTYYRDADSDGFGDPDTAMSSADCTPPAGFVSVGTDCDDGDMAIHPGAAEACDRVDTNCSLAGPAAGGRDVAEDADGDGHAPLTAACTGGPLPKDDCQDAVAGVHPGAAEVCDGIDNDCDGTADNASVVDAACGPSRACDAGACTHSSNLSAGGAFACALDAGVVRCWGAGGEGQLGDGTMADRARAISVVGLSGAVELSLGNQHACARRADGSVWCWGSNASGQLGSDSSAGGPVRSAVPVAVPGLSDAVEIAAGGFFSCARRAAGPVVCWGNNNAGQLGGSPASRGALVSRDVGDVTALAAGLEHACALRSNGSLRCWGGNLSGQLGDGTTMGGTALANPGLTDATQIAAGLRHTCALTASGVRCWGDGMNGQIGGAFMATSPAAPVAGVGSVQELALGGSASCAWLIGGGVRCWGQEQMVGSGSVYNGGSPESVHAVSAATGLELGDTFACARTPAGIGCWGGDEAGQLGDGPDQTLRVTSLPGGRPRVGGQTNCEASGGNFICASAVRGSWTPLDDWQRTYPVPVAGAPRGTITQVDVDAFVACALSSDGKVWCFGGNENGQLGRSTGGAGGASDAGAVVGLTGAVEVATGQASACAVVAGGEVRCWGWNLFGQLGDGTTTNSVVPVAVVTAGGSHLSGVTELEVGDIEACALVPPRDLRCWGGNSYGPVPVSLTWPAGAPASVAQLSAGSGHFCVLGDDASLWCWGSNSSGELGSTGSSATPVRAVPALGAIQAAGAGNSRTCAVTSDGSVHCWGSGFGMSPITVLGLSAAVDVDVDSQICATSAAGDVYCTGSLGFPIPRDAVPGIP